MESSGPWQSLSERVDPQLTSYTVSNLKPFTTYRFRIQATNDIGPSRFSPESIEVRTYPAGKLCYLDYWKIQIQCFSYYFSPKQSSSWSESCTDYNHQRRSILDTYRRTILEWRHQNWWIPGCISACFRFSHCFAGYAKGRSDGNQCK